MKVNIDPDLYKKAKDRVEEIKGYYTHLIIYLLVNIFLFLIDFLSDRANWWFYWTTFGWGIGILAHTLGTFGFAGMFGPEWEKKEIEKYIKKNSKD